MLFDIERELFLLQLSGENSELASLSRRQGYRQITEMQRLGCFEARAADVPRGFGCNERLIYCLQTCFRQSGSKNNTPPPGRPPITTLLKVSVIVTSICRDRFMAARKLLKRLRHATGTRISVYTVRNHLRGASLIFEL